MQTDYTRSLTLLALVGLGGAAVPSLSAADAPAEPPKPKWETSAGLSATLTAGNSESLTFGANALMQYKAEKNEARISAEAGYGEARPAGDPDADPERNTAYVKGAAHYNRLLNERLFYYAHADVLHDDISDVQYRLTLSPGIGYYFIKEANLTLSGEVGPGYVFERVANDNNDYATLRVSERLEYKISESARLWQMAEYLPEVTRWADNYIINFEVGVAAALTKKLELRVVAYDTYDPEPAAGRKENDFKLMAGINYKF